MFQVAFLALLVKGDQFLLFLAILGGGRGIGAAVGGIRLTGSAGVTLALVVRLVGQGLRRIGAGLGKGFFFGRLLRLLWSLCRLLPSPR